jgi:hypothetical protein
MTKVYILTTCAKNLQAMQAFGGAYKAVKLLFTISKVHSYDGKIVVFTKKGKEIEWHTPLESALHHGYLVHVIDRDGDIIASCQKIMVQ